MITIKNNKAVVMESDIIKEICDWIDWRVCITVSNSMRDCPKCCLYKYKSKCVHFTESEALEIINKELDKIKGV